MPESTLKKGKRGGKTRTSWKPGGPSPNPGGRPKNHQSISWWIGEFGQMSPAVLADVCEAYAKDLRTLKGELPFYALIAVRVLWTIAQEGAPGLLAQVFERTEGRVPQTLTVNWKEELEKHGLNASDIFEELVRLAGEQIAQAPAGTNGSGSPDGSAEAAKLGPEAVAGTGEAGTKAA